MKLSIMPEIIIHRGTHEIGGSAVEIASSSGRILLDIGTPLDFDKRAASKRTGAELVASGDLPDIRGLYAWDTPLFDAVIISHAHLDHYGFAHFVHTNIPLCLSRGTQTLMSISARFLGAAEVKNKQRIFEMYKPFTVAGMKITPYLMDHSAFDAAAFVVEVDKRRIVYTGDFRNHGRKSGVYKRFIGSVRPKADLLLCEGSTLGRPDGKSQTEDELEFEITEHLKRTAGMALFQCSAQNIDRLVTFYKASRKSNRLFVIDAYTANVLRELRELGNKLPFPSPNYANIRVISPQRQKTQIAEKSSKEYVHRFTRYEIGSEEIATQQREILMMVRPSGTDFLKQIDGFTNGTFIYSLWNGYRDGEKQIAFERFLAERGFPCVEMHTSGHADAATIRGLVTALDPKKIVPIHTFHPEVFGEFSDKVYVAENGEKICVE